MTWPALSAIAAASVLTYLTLDAHWQAEARASHAGRAMGVQCAAQERDRLVCMQLCVASPDPAACVLAVQAVVVEVEQEKKESRE